MAGSYNEGVWMVIAECNRLAFIIKVELSLVGVLQCLWLAYWCQAQYMSVSLGVHT